jgi:alditol oxidase
MSLRKSAKAGPSSPQSAPSDALTNWSGSYHYGAGTLYRPTSLGQLRELVARATSIRAIGSRHSFTAIGDAQELVSTERIPGAITVDAQAGTVTAPAHATYAQVARELAPYDLALHNLASLPHISIAGAIATGTHGSGDRAGNLATAVAGVELVTSSGEMLAAARGETDFDGLVIGLGALGVMTRVTLETEPAHQVSQFVYEALPWDALIGGIDAIAACGDSVSVFHRFGERAEQVWVKRRVTGREPASGETERSRDGVRQLLESLGATAARTAVHPVPGGDPDHCTPQLGAPGSWSERLPHFRPEYEPGIGDEIQSEFFVARADAPAALEALRELRAQLDPILLVSELRTIAGDSLWLSPHHDRPSLGIHFTWRLDPTAVERAVARIEAALEPFAARPHWGKVFTAGADRIAPLYPRLGDFKRLRDRLDPGGVFVNPWLRAHVLGD